DQDADALARPRHPAAPGGGRHLRAAAPARGGRPRGAPQRGRAAAPGGAHGRGWRQSRGQPAMSFWILAGLLSACIVALLAIPFLRRRKVAAEDHPDPAAYRDQLAELEREVGRGLLPEAEAASARLEIQRRLLAAAGAAAPEAAARRGSARALAAAILLL